MIITQKESSIGQDTRQCIQCGAPLLGLEGIKAVIGGSHELFCKGYCIGQYRQQEAIAYHHHPSRVHMNRKQPIAP